MITAPSSQNLFKHSNGCSIASMIEMVAYAKSIKNWDKIFYCALCIVCNRNSVSVLGTETKVQFRYRCRSRFFFPKPKLFFFFFFPNFFMYFCFLGEYEFLKTWNWTQTFKSYLKVTETMTKPVTKPVTKPLTNPVTKQVIK